MTARALTPLAIAAVIALAMPSSAMAGRYTHYGWRNSSAPVHVRSYVRRDGHYVRPYVRTAPNNTKFDNWSTRGNINPYTGKAGTKSPF